LFILFIDLFVYLFTHAFYLFVKRQENYIQRLTVGLRHYEAINALRESSLLSSPPLKPALPISFTNSTAGFFVSLGYFRNLVKQKMLLKKDSYIKSSQMITAASLQADTSYKVVKLIDVNSGSYQGLHTFMNQDNLVVYHRFLPDGTIKSREECCEDLSAQFVALGSAGPEVVYTDSARQEEAMYMRAFASLRNQVPQHQPAGMLKLPVDDSLIPNRVLVSSASDVSRNVSSLRTYLETEHGKKAGLVMDMEWVVAKDSPVSTLSLGIKLGGIHKIITFHLTALFKG
jgi:hypothetical protein